TSAQGTASDGVHDLSILVNMSKPTSCTYDLGRGLFLATNATANATCVVGSEISKVTKGGNNCKTPVMAR
ncbi:MAG: hypothetical protein K2X63_00505, partial [Burkholderiaceae bacterium]|nr:hypothetical protein [Burkholderiaceae bacterium]